MKILLDPGHGIETPGKRSPDGKFLEYYAYFTSKQNTPIISIEPHRMGLEVIDSPIHKQNHPNAT